ncbi:hypothetical protein GF371_02320 [Candidatus Woesearchaeota archaeon]|nr:hypothetical protein [Candidatus Woesearchaeota archaeon]
MSKEREQLFKILMEKQGESIETLAKDLQVSPDFIRGIAAGNKNFSLNDDFVLLAGFGVSRCIVCSETDYMDEDYYGWRWAVNIELPSEMLRDYDLGPQYSREIRGHKKCYSKIDVWFRYEEGFHCIDCSSFRGEWVDGNEVVEGCSIMKQRELGHQGVMADDNMCNYFRPDSEVTEDHAEKWERVKTAIEARTQQGYRSLIAHLEKLRLLRKKQQPAQTG